VREFWVSSGHHLSRQNEAGELVATPELMMAWLARPELAPPPEACDAERALHATLLADPFRAVAEAYRAAAGPALAGWDADAMAAGVAAGLVFHALSYARIVMAAPAAQRWQLDGAVRYLVRRLLRSEGLAT
jgi:hypothetical protein